MTTAPRPTRRGSASVPGHVAWVAGEAHAGAAHAEEAHAGEAHAGAAHAGEVAVPAVSGTADRGGQALLALVEAALGVGVGWLTVQDPSGGGAIRERAAALAARGVAVAETPEASGPAPRDLVEVRAPVLRVLLAKEGSGRRELVGAVQALADQGLRGRAVKEATIGAVLAVPDVDLLVLVGGDRRVPDLLVWQVAYSEIVVLDRPWPEVGAEEFDAAVAEYQRRDRRYGGLVGSR